MECAIQNGVQDHVLVLNLDQWGIVAGLIGQKEDQIAHVLVLVLGGN
ncbi:hypothetical protein LJC57_01470 [Parabacteroides sp. OttesenSCG-928-G07]|nr:hypothetical protein [Parabacteroides sp. OttesenSCG-928-G07]